jgi:soluble lytic murein transglycosylase-like protein
VRRAATLLLLALAVPAFGQVRTERDSSGQIVITNKGSKAAAKLSAQASAGTVPKVTSGQRQAIQKELKAACAAKGLDYNLVAALVDAESSFQTSIISKKGAIGLMQLLPATGKRFGCNDPWDMQDNIRGGTNFLAYLQDLFGGDIPLMLAAYNAGEDAVRKYSNKIPPYAETVRYVFNILSDYGRPSLIAEAKTKLASPSDYDRFFVPHRGEKPVMRTYYMYFSEQGVRTIVDYPPSGVKFIPIVYKDE